MRGGKRSCLVVPLALPEWRDAHAVGALSSGGGRLTLSQQAQGRNLCCPLFIDLDPRRVAKQRTWRQLTVAESLEIVGPDVLERAPVPANRGADCVDDDGFGHGERL